VVDELVERDRVLVGRQAGQPASERVAQREPALLLELVDRRGGELLGE
jgi:hypothetical protein